MPSYFTFKEFTLEYFIFGNGKNNILYFHGYGKTAQEFLEYETELTHDYTVYAFNFFHHGQSRYPEHRIHENTLKAQEFCELMEAFCQEKNIQNFGLIGYSMGGKLSLLLLNRFPERIDFIILNAPDGVKRNFWYRFTSRSKLGNQLYRRIIEKPNGFFAFTRLLKKTKLLHTRLHDFVYARLETKEKRMHVYKVWMTLRLLEPDLKENIRLIQKNNIKLCLNYGKYDKVITPPYGQKFHRKTQPHSTFNLLEKGHNLVYAETGRLMDQFIRTHIKP